MSDIERYIKEQFELHPSMEPRDVAKLCYQAAFGAEHLLQDVENAKRYFYKEFESLDPQTDTDEPLVEPIGSGVCRINLGAWKKRSLPPEQLFELFVKSAGKIKKDESQFLSYLEQAERFVKNNLIANISFTVEDWHNFINEYKKGGIRPVHHSKTYREQEKPAYRVVDDSIFKLSGITDI
ncbi:MAG: hypothetical protein FWC91_01890 [Defluviitaleaceae bacterium]|nr:hypothetical protein [Defluviitaleaceae bacterium]